MPCCLSLVVFLVKCFSVPLTRYQTIELLLSTGNFVDPHEPLLRDRAVASLQQRHRFEVVTRSYLKRFAVEGAQELPHRALECVGEPDLGPARLEDDTGLGSRREMERAGLAFG